MPGGDNIGARQIDMHMKGLAQMGASLTISHGYVEAEAKRLTGTRLYLDFASVGATENLVMAAVLADGTTVLENAAMEPEIGDLLDFLCRMGARITRRRHLDPGHRGVESLERRRARRHRGPDRGGHVPAGRRDHPR